MPTRSKGLAKHRGRTRDRRKAKALRPDFQRSDSQLATARKQALQQAAAFADILLRKPGLKAAISRRVPVEAVPPQPPTGGDGDDERFDAVEAAERRDARTHDPRSLHGSDQQESEDRAEEEGLNPWKDASATDDNAVAWIAQALRTGFASFSGLPNPVVAPSSGHTLAEALYVFLRAEHGWAAKDVDDESRAQQVDRIAHLQRTGKVPKNLDANMFAAKLEEHVVALAARLTAEATGATNGSAEGRSAPKARTKEQDKRVDRETGRRVLNFDWMYRFDPGPLLEEMAEGETNPSRQVVLDRLLTLAKSGQVFRLRYPDMRTSTVELLALPEPQNSIARDILEDFVRHRNEAVFLSSGTLTDLHIASENGRSVVHTVKANAAALIDHRAYYINRSVVAAWTVKLAEAAGVPVDSCLVKTEKSPDMETKATRERYVARFEDLRRFAQSLPNYPESDVQAVFEELDPFLESRNQTIFGDGTERHSERRRRAFVQAIVNLQDRFFETLNPEHIVPVSYGEIIGEFFRGGEESLARSIGEADFILSAEGNRSRNTIASLFSVRDSDGPHSRLRWVRLQLPDGRVISMEHFVNSQSGNFSGQVEWKKKGKTQEREFLRYADEPAGKLQFTTMARIRSIIGEEPLDAPLSDNDIKKAWAQRGFGYAPAVRTIAKYRERMGISASAQRRQPSLG